MTESFALPPPKAVLIEAIGWLRTLSRTHVTAQALKDFDMWRRRGPTHRAAYDDLSARFFDAVFQTPPDRDAADRDPDPV